jgi:uncharacterized protein (TIGR02266 family)
MGLPASIPDERAIRVVVPILASFATETFAIREFTVNLSEGGVFLPTEKSRPPGTRGSLRFRVTQFEDPFTLQAEVVHVIAPDNEAGRPAGMGIRFLDVSSDDRKRLHRLVEGVRDGSVVDAIRRSMREGRRSLLEELRRRPVDQKMMLAISARTEEIYAILRDGNPTVVERCLQNPRFLSKHVVALLRDVRTSTRLLRLINANRSWMSDHDVRWHFCNHLNATVDDVLAHLPQLPVPRLRQLAEDRRIRQPIRAKAREWAKRKMGGGQSRVF